MVTLCHLPSVTLLVPVMVPDLADAYSKYPSLLIDMVPVPAISSNSSNTPGFFALKLIVDVKGCTICSGVKIILLPLDLFLESSIKDPFTLLGKGFLLSKASNNEGTMV